MVFFRIWKYFNPIRCCFCNDTDIHGEMLCAYTQFLSWDYHQKCLTDVVCFPEKHPNKIGMAYKLTKVIEQGNAREKKELLALIRLQPKYKCKPCNCTNCNRGQSEYCLNP